MGSFAHTRFLHYHGERGARLSRDQCIHRLIENPRSMLIKCLAPAFFNAPMVHLVALEKIWVDRILCKLPWATFIEKLKNEWQEFVLYSTVLLNANVAFLAIPSVDPNSNSSSGTIAATRTPAQIASYASIISSIGSIILGLLLIRQYRVKPIETVGEAGTFLMKMNHPTRGVETLAILYSLPYALLMWGMVTFLLALSFECFQSSTNAAVSVAGVIWSIMAFLIAWCIYAGWESKHDPLVKRIYESLKDSLAQLHERNTMFVQKILSSTAHSEPPASDSGTNV